LDGEWGKHIAALGPYFRYNDAAWGELGVVSAQRWEKDVQYKAVQRLLAERLGGSKIRKSLLRRVNERDYWGGSRRSLLTILLHFLYLETFKRSEDNSHKVSNGDPCE
jgi:hypothetical protein